MTPNPILSLAERLRLFGSLFKTFAVLCTQQRCSRRRPDFPGRFPEAERAVRDHQLGLYVEPAPLQIEQQGAPIVRTFPGAIGEPDQLFLAFRCRADDNENALLLIFEAGL